ncbi:MAG: RagB/SusD family nutrient uptake outer membrane protein [Alistipes sp.]|nr:RagB/SusD family nutrient uptake outer membrane protein [Alistipes sp.]
MKKIVYMLASAALLCSSVSCSDMVESESKSSFDASVVFAYPTLAEENIMSIYQIFGQNNAYRNRHHLWYGYNTDIEWYNSAKEGDAKTTVIAYDPQVNETGVPLDAANGVYTYMYTAVERCNLCIDGIRRYGNPEQNPEMAYLLGEALTLRAMFYFDLIKTWGDVPARFEPINSATIYVAKTDRDVIFEQLIADLQEACEYLYWPGETAATSLSTRMNKAFAKGLLARICMQAAGYAQRPDDGQVGTGNIGSVRRSTRVVSGDWSGNYLYDIALKACQDVIAQEGKSVALAPTFEKLWRDMMGYENVAAGEEVLFAVPFGHETRRGQWCSQYAVRHEGADQYVGKGMGGSVGPVPTMYYEYGAGDTRAMSCVNFLWGKPVSKVSTPAPANFNKWYFGKFRYEWIPNGQTIGSANNDDGVKPIVMRYADVLLLAAEAANEMDQLGVAKEYLRKVRMRAYAGDAAAVEDFLSTITNKEQMFQALFTERALEFCGEMIRKQDLIRWGLLGDALDEAKEKMKQIRVQGSYTSAITGKTYDYSQVGPYLYYKLNGEQIEMQMSSTDADQTLLGAGWTQWYEEEAGESGAKEKKYEYVKESKLNDEKIELIYLRDPDTRQYWPIFSASIASNYMLVNDYGY